MKIDFGSEITDFDGNPVQNGQAGPLLAGTGVGALMQIRKGLQSLV